MLLVMNAPLLLTDILHCAAISHGETEIVSHHVDGIHRHSCVAAKERCPRLSAALRFPGLPGRRPPRVAAVKYPSSNTADTIGMFRPGYLDAVMPVAPLFHADSWMMPFTDQNAKETSAS